MEHLYCVGILSSWWIESLNFGSLDMTVTLDLTNGCRVLHKNDLENKMLVSGSCKICGFLSAVVHLLFHNKYMINPWSGVSVNMFLNVVCMWWKIPFYCLQWGILFERSDFVPNEVNRRIFMEDGEIEIVIPFPKEQISEG